MSLEYESEAKLARARAFIRQKAPYICKTVYGFVPVHVAGIKTMAVSEDMVLIYDGEWMKDVPDHKVAATLFHEAMHIVRDHLPRMLMFPDRDMANAAGDLAINSELRDAGWELPHGIFPEDYGFPKGLTLEEYYKLLEARRKQQQQQQSKAGKGKGSAPQPTQGQKNQSDGQGDDGKQGGGPKDQQANAQGGKRDPQQQQGPQQGGGAGKNQGQNPQPQQGGQGQSKDKGQSQDGGGHSHMPDNSPPGVGRGKCGGCANNPVSPAEKEQNEKNGRSEAEKKVIVQQTLEDIKQHVEAHGRGSVPGSLIQAMEISKKPAEVPWRSKLNHWLRKCFSTIESGGMDYSLALPSKQSYASGFPRPGLVAYQPEVAFIVDTSLSMGEEQLKSALTEAVGIMTALGLEAAWLIQADTTVAAPPKKIRMRDLLGRVKFHGRGGTNFDPALRVAAKLKPKVDLIVYLTDGDGYVTFRPPGITVVWCIVRNHWNRKPPCDWGHTVIVAEEARANVRLPRSA